MTVVRRTFTRTFRSLGRRNYRLYFFGQIVSVTGTWVQSVAQIWLVLKLTGSGLALGLTAGLQFLPVLLAGPWGGLVADRFDKRRILIGTQAASGTLALVLGVLVLTNQVRLWMVFALAFALGIVTLFDNPTRQSFVVEMVGPQDVANGVSLNSAVFTATRVVGPALAGLLIATVGLAACFLLNAASYLAVILGLAAMRASELHRQAPVPRARGQLREAFRYVWETPGLRWPLVLMGVVYTFAFNFSVLLPLQARDAFHAGPGLFGTFFSLMGVGSLGGALVMANQRRPTARVLVLSAVGIGVVLLAVASAPILGAEMVALVTLGFAGMAFMATGNSMLQFAARPSVRGRVMALYAMVFLGSTPVGGPLAGFLAERFGPRAALGIAGLVALCAGAAGWFVLRRRGRQLFFRLLAGTGSHAAAMETTGQPVLDASVREGGRRTA